MATSSKPAVIAGTAAILFVKLLNAACPALSARGLFEPGSISAISVASGDFNGDGNLDVVVLGNSSASLLFGDGAGNFVAGPPFATGPGSFAFGPTIATGDFNRDGKLDFAVADIGDGAALVFLGNGDGTFPPPIAYLGGGGEELQAADVNGDGILDLVTVNPGSNSGGGLISVELGIGDGTFDYPLTTTITAQGSYFALGYFDADNIPDMAITHPVTGRIRVYHGNGDGTFTEIGLLQSDIGASEIVSADMNGDGHPDLAVANYNGSISVFLGNGDGSFANPLLEGTEAYLWFLAAADVNGDGHPDLLVSSSEGHVTTMMGKGDGTLVTSDVNPISQLPVALALGDFRHSGNLDVVVAGESIVAFAPGRGDGTFLRPDFALTGMAAVFGTPTFADFNGDQRPDIAIAEGNSVVLQFRTASAFVAGPTLTLSANMTAVAGDFNGDGKADLAASDSVSTIETFFGNGDGTFRVPVTQSGNGFNWGAIAADLDGDGRDDLIIPGEPFQVLRSIGDGTFATAVSYSPGGSSVTVADLNRDGRLDLVVLPRNGTTVFVYLGNGDTTFAPALSFDTGLLPAAPVLARDFDGDGTPDLLVSDRFGAGAAFFHGSGDGTFQPAVAIPNGSGFLPLAGDFDQDGRLDFAVFKNNIGRIAIFQGRGDGTFAGPVLSGAGVGAVSANVFDIDLDGRSDILMAYGRELRVYRNAWPIIRPDILPAGALSQSYSAQLIVLDGGPGEIFSTADLLPPGLSLSASGLLNGTPAVAGTFSFSITATDTNGCTANRLYRMAVSPTSIGLTFYTLAPCRLIDTRRPAGTWGGPPLSGNGATRDFPVVGQCGIPADAQAVSANVTVVNPGAGGDIRIFPTGFPSSTSVLNFRAGQTRANNAILALTGSPSGSATVQADIPNAGSNLIVDVNGYFR
jgi:hypothetical protein